MGARADGESRRCRTAGGRDAQVVEKRVGAVGGEAERAQLGDARLVFNDRHDRAVMRDLQCRADPRHAESEAVVRRQQPTDRLLELNDGLRTASVDVAVDGQVISAVPAAQGYLVVGVPLWCAQTQDGLPAVPAQNIDIGFKQEVARRNHRALVDSGGAVSRGVGLPQAVCAADHR